MSLKELIDRFGSYRPEPPVATVAKPGTPCDTSRGGEKASKISTSLEIVATVATVAGVQALVSGFSPKTEIGEKLKRAALSFLASDQWQTATEFGWTEVELFGVYNHDEPDVINRRADAKGVVAFTALAVWPNTRIERIEAGYAVIVTGGGGVFMSPKRGDRLSASVPFWQIEAL
jgi:hypothetical protein